MESWTSQKEAIADLYTSQVRQHGQSYKSVCWGSQKGQLLRFKILSEIAKLSNCSILDVGCGLGDFFSFLKQKEEGFEYHGVDISKAMIETAQSVQNNVKFSCTDILTQNLPKQFDYVIASGLFNRLTERPFETMQALISKMFKLSKKGVAFNSLSGWKQTEYQSDFTPDPLEVIAFCRTLTPWIVTRFDYMPHDFTVYLYHQPKEI